jgi:hypothetical protein
MIPVMKAADLRDRNDAPARWRLRLAPMGAAVVEGLMRARGVVVREVSAQQAAEHSRRIDPMTRSANGFCQGARGAMRISRIPRPLARRTNTSP